eukprot:TRINITY_DN329_c0_g1_i3.p1 TRINITY_DN329_c0_g1~~TRINITY_DN329_c0_g1_i3.p1  ORF type:complete len:295 (-),score=28.55 TRINITY_DN329_c0_g1_i3:49-933(-)
MSNCSYRWTGENCTIDNFSLPPVLILTTTFISITVFARVAITILYIRGIIRKRELEGTSWKSLCFISGYIMVVCSGTSVVYALDPWEIVPVNTVLRLVMRWFPTILLFSGAVLAYVIWLEAIRATKKLKRHDTLSFRVAKISIIIYVGISSSVFVIALLIVFVLDQSEAFNTVMIVISIIFTIGYMGMHIYFLPTIVKVVKNTSSLKIKRIHKFVNALVFVPTTLNLVQAVVRIILESIFLLSNPARIYISLGQKLVETIGAWLIFYCVYQILFGGLKTSRSSSHITSHKSRRK